MSEAGPVQQRRGLAAAGPRIGVIGMGQVGPGIASALRAAGFVISGVAVRRSESEERADAALPGVPIKTDSQVARESDVLLLAVADEDIEPLTKVLVQEGAIHPGQVVVHLAGSLGLQSLAPATAIGALPIAMHPAMTFTGTSLDVHRLQGTPIAYTAAAVAAPLAITLIESIGGIPFEVPDAKRSTYHSALTQAADDITASLAAAASTLEDAGVQNPLKVLGPMAREAVERSLAEDEFDLDDDLLE